MTNQLPAHLQNRPSRNLTQRLQQNLGSGAPPYLSIEGNRLHLIDAVGNSIPVPTYDPNIGPYIDVNIIDIGDVISKVYYDPSKPYDPKNPDPSPPICWSDNGIGPSRQSSSPQAPTCAACPNNVWGSEVSRVTGKGIKACKDHQKIAFTTAGHRTVFLLRVPPNSLSELRSYTGKFAGQQVEIDGVITRISFKAGIQGTLQFQATSYVDASTAALADEILAAKATDAIVGRTDTVHPGAAGIAYQPPAELPAPATTANQSNPQDWGPGRSGTAMGTTAPSTVPPASAEAPAPRRGRPRGTSKSAEAAPVQQQAPLQAPFPTSAPPAAAQPNGQAPGNNFGIAPGVEPNQEITQTLNSLFGPAQ